ncbi:MAG: hypothetical protein HY078_13700 [Elusimicrobia bacterium]|nr:hypothetical protein [Elusimicrobiota bacterium]
MKTAMTAAVLTALLATGARAEWYLGTGVVKSEKPKRTDPAAVDRPCGGASSAPSSRHSGEPKAPATNAPARQSSPADPCAAPRTPADRNRAHEGDVTRKASEDASVRPRPGMSDKQRRQMQQNVRRAVGGAARAASAIREK